jgi:hypothetical protein
MCAQNLATAAEAGAIISCDRAAIKLAHAQEV